MALDTMEKQPEHEISHAGSSLETASPELQVNSKRERALLRKIDLHLMGPLWVVFVFGFLDRINLGNVAVLGILKELKMNGKDMALAMQIFFVPYIIADIPSNIILKKFSPSTWISILTFFWGKQSSLRALSSAGGARLTLCYRRHMYVPGRGEEQSRAGCMPLLHGSLRRRLRAWVRIPDVHVLQPP